MHKADKYSFILCRPEEELAVGRPREEVDVHEIEYLRTIGFHWSEVALLLSTSRSTLYQRLSEQGINPHSHYSSITDSQLDQEIQAIKVHHPNVVKFLLQLTFDPEDYMCSDQDYELQFIELIQMELKLADELQSIEEYTVCLILTTYGT